MFDWDRNWAKVNTFTDHEHYIMQIAINPKDTSMFASASLDKTIRIWTVSTAKSTANYTLVGHDQGVNCLDFSRDLERPHLVSGADDGLVAVADHPLALGVVYRGLETATNRPYGNKLMTVRRGGGERAWNGWMFGDRESPSRAAPRGARQRSRV